MTFLKERSSFYTSLFPHTRASATLALKPYISVPVALRDMIFCTHLVFVVDCYVRKFYQNRSIGYGKRAKNNRTLSEFKFGQTLTYSSGINFSHKEMINKLN